MLMKCLVFLALILNFIFIEGKNIDIRLPNVRPLEDDAYLCHSIDMSQHNVSYIKEFIPRHESGFQHHILLYTCDSAPPAETWQCSEMESHNAQYDQFDLCDGVSTIIYAWAMDAPPMKLPKDISFKVGTESSRYLVLQVHYKDASAFLKNDALRDSAGVTLVTSDTPTSKAAGVLLSLTNGYIPGNSIVYMEAACPVAVDVDIHPFAYRVHTHGLGKVVSGYVIHDDKWTELGRISPQKPQMFYNVTNPDVIIKTNDYIAARCVMENDKDETVKIGMTRKDEMCNFYLMYWVDAKESEKMPTGMDAMCLSPGWPRFKWSNILDNSNEPKEAAIIPGESTVIPEMDLLNYDLDDFDLGIKK